MSLGCYQLLVMQGLNKVNMCKSSFLFYHHPGMDHIMELGPALALSRHYQSISQYNAEGFLDSPWTDQGLDL